MLTNLTLDLNRATVSALTSSLVRCIYSFYRAMLMHKRGICRHPVSVCVSVTFVSYAKTNKDILEIFRPLISQAILVFPHQTGWRYSDANPYNGGRRRMQGGMKKIRFSTNISLYLRNGYSQMGTFSEAICKHRILFPSI